VVVGVLLAAAVLYVQASRDPAGYEPLDLPPDQRDEAAREFLDRLLGSEFNDRIQRMEPFTWTVTQEDLDRYLASMDEIAWRAHQPRASVSQVLDAAGLSGLAVRLQDGGVTLMVQSTQYDKVLSADVAVGTGDDGRLKMALSRFRVGRLTVPGSVLLKRLGQVRSRLREELRGEAPPPQRDGPPAAAALSAENFGGLALALLGALEGEAVEPAFNWTLGGRREVRIEELKVQPGLLTLRLRPMPRDP